MMIGQQKDVLGMIIREKLDLMNFSSREIVNLLDSRDVVVQLPTFHILRLSFGEKTRLKNI